MGDNNDIDDDAEVLVWVVDGTCSTDDNNKAESVVVALPMHVVVDVAVVTAVKAPLSLWLVLAVILVSIAGVLGEG